MGGRGATSSQIKANIEEYMAGYKSTTRSPDDWNNIEGRKKWMDEDAEENFQYAKKTKQIKRTRFTGHVVDDLETIGVKVSKNIYDKAKAEKNKIDAKGDSKLSRDLREAHKEARDSFIERGIKPHLEVINRQVGELKKLYPQLNIKNVELADFGKDSSNLQLKGDTIYLNQRFISIPKVNEKISQIGSIAKDYNDYLTSILGTSVQNDIANHKSILVKKQYRALKRNWEEKYKSDMGSLTRQKASKDFDVAFREAFTQNMMYRKGKTTELHPMAKDIDDILKLMKNGGYRRVNRRSKKKRG